MRSFNFAPHVSQEMRAYLIECAQARADWAYIYLDEEGHVQRTWERPGHVYYAEFVPPEIYQAQDDVLSERINRMGHSSHIEAPPGIEEAEWANMWT